MDRNCSWSNAVVVGALLGAGCSSGAGGTDRGKPDGGVDAAASGSGGRGGAMESGASGAAGVGGSADPQRHPTYRAFLSVERWERLDPAAKHTMAAYQPFRLDDQQPRYEQVDAHCGYHEGDWRSPDRPMPSFGTVTMRTPLLGEVSFTGNGYETPEGVSGWDTGDLVTVVASGGALPGFTIEDTVPPQAILSTYDLFHVHARDIVIPRDEPLALSWAPVGTEVFALFLQFDDASYLRYGVWCLLPAAPGNVQIPTEVLSHLVPSTEVTNTNFYFGGASRKELALDDVDLEMITWKAQAARVVVQ